MVPREKKHKGSVCNNGTAFHGVDWLEISFARPKLKYQEYYQLMYTVTIMSINANFLSAVSRLG